MTRPGIDPAELPVPLPQGVAYLGGARVSLGGRLLAVPASLSVDAPAARRTRGRRCTVSSIAGMDRGSSCHPDISPYSPGGMARRLARPTMALPPAPSKAASGAGSAVREAENTCSHERSS